MWSDILDSVFEALRKSTPERLLARARRFEARALVLESKAQSAKTLKRYTYFAKRANGLRAKADHIKASVEILINRKVDQ